MKFLLKKELSFYLNNPIGYIVVLLFSIFANFLFVKDIFVTGSASMRPFFELLPWLLLIFIPALTMRMISEERRTNTLEVLLTLPISELNIVISKYLSALIICIIALLLTTALPMSMYFLTGDVGGKLYLPEITVSYLGSIAVASSFISISLFFSALTKNQIIAFLTSVVVIFFLVIFSTDFAGNVLPTFLQTALNYLSPVTQFASFIRGVIDVRSVFYFLSFTAVFLILTIIDLERRA
jgi:ABC-2 type transport system permease protein